MVTVAWDTSNLVALFKDGLQCMTCCQFVSGSPPADCCCFLDPTTFAWDRIRTFAQGDLCEDGGHTYESVQNGNQDHVTSDTDWWTHVSANVSCGNADWDAFPPYGGPAKTPAFYTVTAHITFPSGASYSWYSDSVPHSTVWGYPYSAGPCGWRTDPLFYVPDGHSNHFALAPDSLHGGCEPSNPEEWWVTWNLKNDAAACDEGAAYTDIGDIAAFIGAIPCLGGGPLADCPTSGTITGNDGDTTDICIKRLTGTGPNTWESGSGTLSWHPGKVAEWDNSTGYTVGNIVAWEGVFYICTADNTNQEPPNVAYWDVI